MSRRLSVISAHVLNVVSGNASSLFALSFILLYQRSNLLVQATHLIVRGQENLPSAKTLARSYLSVRV